MSGHGAARAAAYDAAARHSQRQLFMGMNAFDRHRKMVHDLVAYYGAQLPAGGQAGPEKTDYDILRENHRFIRSEEDDAADSWEVRLAKRYYSKLFKEYAIADLSRYREGKVGLRWRTQREVVAGRGQFVCGATGCNEQRGLASFEVPFAYQEAGERKQALVKLRVCPTHAYQLNYRKHKEAERAQKERRKRREERRRRIKGKDRRKSKGSTSSGSSKERKRRRRRGDSSSRTASSSLSSSSSDSGSSSSEEDEEEEGQRSGKRRRRQCETAAAASAGPAEEPAAQGAPPTGAPGEDDFEAFLQGLFE